MSTQANLGQKALDIRDYPEAIRQYTAALSTNLDNPSPLWLIQRATAYQRSSKFDLALLDAEAALLAARRRSRREFIATAQFRRAVALHGLKRYGDARLCLVWCRAANEKEKALGIWQEKVTNDYAKAEKEFGKDSEQCRTTVKEIPDKVEVVGVKEVDTKVNTAPKSTPAAISATPKEKIRHDWLQSGSKVTITIYAKGVPKDKATVDIQADSLDISFPVGSGSEYSLNFEPLFATVDPAQSTFSISPYKIEISLHKATPNQKWSALEGDAKVASKADPSPTVQPQVVETNKTPSYPTSSRSGPKNWDAVATSSLENEGEEEASVDSFFQKLYKDADPDTRKAMLKSYQESNGTALSMNWNDVKKGPVPTSPPDGVEAKPW